MGSLMESKLWDEAGNKEDAERLVFLFEIRLPQLYSIHNTCFAS
jgi:hypothetical protein